MNSKANKRRNKKGYSSKEVGSQLKENKENVIPDSDTKSDDAIYGKTNVNTLENDKGFQSEGLEMKTDKNVIFGDGSIEDNSRKRNNSISVDEKNEKKNEKEITNFPENLIQEKEQVKNNFNDNYDNQPDTRKNTHNDLEEISFSNIKHEEDHDKLTQENELGMTAQKNILEKENINYGDNFNDAHDITEFTPNKFKTHLNEQFNTPISPKSNSDFGDFFSFAQQSNAKRIQSQIVELQSKAEDYIKYLTDLAANFDKMKDKLNNSSNKLFNSIFSLLGYTYNTNIKHSNLFVLLSEAWLVNLGRLLRTKPLVFSQAKFFDILKLIKTNEESEGVSSEQETTFLKDVSALTGNILIEKQPINTFTLIQNNISKNFLHSLSFVIINEYNLEESTEIGKEEFEHILSTILKKAVEKTLNAEMQTDMYSFVDFANINDKLAEEKIQNYDFYYKKVTDNFRSKIDRSLNAFEMNEIKICTESFYNFSKVSINDLSNDLNYFICNYSSLLFRVKRFFSQSYYKYQNLYDKMKSLFEYFSAVRGLTQDKLTHSKAHINHMLIKTLAKTVKAGDVKVRRVKVWLEDSLSYIKQLQLIDLSYAAVIKTISLPLVATKDVIKFTITKAEIGYEKFIILKNKLKLLLKTFVCNTANLVKEEVERLRNLIRIEILGDKLKIFVKRDLLSFSRLSGLYFALVGIYRLYYKWIVDKKNKTLDFLAEKKKNLENYGLEKYRSFLNLRNDKNQNVELTTLKHN